MRRRKFMLVILCVFLATITNSLQAQSGETQQRTRRGDSPTTNPTSRRSADTPPDTIVTDASLIKKFAPWSASETAIIIPKISFGDAALEKLLAEVKQAPSVKKASLYYKDQVAVITLIHEGKANHHFWDALSAQTRNAFSIRDNPERCLLLTYLPAQRDNQSTSTRNNTAGNIQVKENRSNQQQSQNNTVTTDTEKWPDDPYTAAIKKAKFGKEGAFIQFKRDGELLIFDEAMIAVMPTPPIMGLSGGLALQFLDFRKNAVIILYICMGGGEIKNGRYTFSYDPNNEITTESPEATTQPQVLFGLEEKRSEPLPPNTFANTLAISITTPQVRQNIVSGYVELNLVDMSGFGRAEGTFQFTTRETKNRQGQIVPGTKITEGKFIAISGGIPVSL